MYPIISNYLYTRRFKIF